MNQRKRKLAIYIVVAALLFGLHGCGSKQHTAVRSEQQIIAELIDKFDAKAENAGLNPLFSELEAVNAKKAEMWRRICGVWSSAYQDGYVHAKCLPDDLPNDDSLAIVVLGFELNSDGSMKEELIGRLTTAFDSAIQYPQAYLVMTGGGTAANNRSVTEADSMANWMLEKGIEPERIIVENQSLSTLENASNSLRILEANYPSVQKLAIVSSDYHVPWGVVDFYAVIQYEACQKGTAPSYEIISNAGYPLNTQTYSYQAIDSCQKSQLRQLETMYREAGMDHE